MTDTKDLTIIYYTANKIADGFGEKVRKQIQVAAEGLPIISVSMVPMDFGQNICIGEKKRSIMTIYEQILLGAKVAKTKYVALAEDDTLYPPEHFKVFRPPEDTFAYDMTRWNILPWKKPPFFSITFRKILAMLLCSRELLTDTIEERFAKYPDPSTIPERWMGEPGRNDYEGKLGVTPRKSMEFYPYIPTVVFSHPESLGYLTTGTRKRSHPIRAFEIPYWGTAQRVMDDYYNDPVRV